MVEYLLDHNAYLEATTINGATPLMRAIESSRPELVQFIIAHGAKLQVENKNGKHIIIVIHVAPVPI